MQKKENKKNEIANCEELSERKRKILFAIIKIYLETGEPVGSRAISKLEDVSLSSATIRNEMSDLTDMGYIHQSHASSGRIPSDKGYRMYVNSLMQEKNLEIKQLRTEMTNRVDKLENTLKDLVENLAKHTNYGALISGPSLALNKIKYVQLSNIEPKKILVVIVCEGNIIKTNIIDVNRIVDIEELLDISVGLNDILPGRSVEDLEKEDIINEIAKKKTSKDVVEILISSIKSSLMENVNDDNIFTYGANNFFKYKELKDNDQATELLKTFEKKIELKKLIDNKQTEENNVQVYIGEESLVPSMKDCSVVTANLDFGNGMKGTIGVVGPKRMDYEKVLKTINKLLNTANEELK